MHDIEYLVPLKVGTHHDIGDLAAYLRDLARFVDTTVVDGSSPEVFARNAELLGECVRHVPVDPALQLANGKVAGVVTGFRMSRHGKVVIADDDVRYSCEQLRRLSDELETAEVVRPQNYFQPMPWHAHWDTARTLLNRAVRADYPGTLAVRLTPELRRHGYDGDVLFENLELIRTVRALGGRERVLLDCYVPRRPPRTGHFWRQRVRQAYDSHAQPVRLSAELAILPILAGTAIRWPRGGAATLALLVGLAEFGRRRAGGRSYFPPSASVWTLAWLAERGACSWAALYLRVSGRGARYGDARFVRAATSARRLRRQLR